MRCLPAQTLPPDSLIGQQDNKVSCLSFQTQPEFYICTTFRKITVFRASGWDQNGMGCVERLNYVCCIDSRECWSHWELSSMHLWTSWSLLYGIFDHKELQRKQLLGNLENCFTSVLWRLHFSTLVFVNMGPCPLLHQDLRSRTAQTPPIPDSVHHNSKAQIQVQLCTKAKVQVQNCSKTTAP